MTREVRVYETAVCEIELKLEYHEASRQWSVQLGKNWNVDSTARGHLPLDVGDEESMRALYRRVGDILEFSTYGEK